MHQKKDCLSMEQEEFHDLKPPDTYAFFDRTSWIAELSFYMAQILFHVWWPDHSSWCEGSHVFSIPQTWKSTYLAWLADYWHIHLQDRRQTQEICPPPMNVISFLMLDKPVSRTNWVWTFFFYHPQNQSQSSWTLCIRHRISPSSNSNILRRMLSLFLPLTNFPISLL